jgi:hypothetical protein
VSVSRVACGVVIPRLDFSALASTQSAEWPESPNRVHSPFQPRASLRKLRLLVDVDVLTDDGTDPYSHARLLAGLLRHPLLDTCRYSDDGPPANALWVQPRFGPEIAVGWVTPHGGDQGFDYSFGEAAWSTGYEPSDARGWAEVPTSVYADLSPDDALARRGRDGVAMAVAHVITPDVFVTNRPHLLAIGEDRRRLTVCDLAEALALLGLYFRCQNDYRIWFEPEGGLNFTLGKGFFFLVASREMLPEAWRWVSACGQHSAGVGDDRLLYLSFSMLERMTRVLKNRDAVNWALNQKLDDGARREDAVDAFETALLMLMGAVDVTARVAHRVLGLPPGQEFGAGWQRKRWVGDVAKVAQNLAAVVTPGTDAREALTILQLIRNSIHGTALRGSEFRDGSRGRRIRMGLPRADQSELVAAMGALGNLTDWGVEEIKYQNRPSEFYADPGVFLDQLLPRICALLNDVMRETPVEGMAHVNLSPAHQRAPSRGVEGIMDRFSPPQAAVVRSLLGI